MKRIITFLILVVFSISLIGCSSNKEVSSTSTSNEKTGKVIVSTMTDTEGSTLGQIIVQALKANGFEVEDNTGTLGSTKLNREAAIQRQADITVSYTGSGMYYMGDKTNVKDPAWRKLEDGYKLIRDFDKKQNNLVWLSPAKANNTELIAVTDKFAKENNIKNMNDFAKYVNKGGKVKLATLAYWAEPDGGLGDLEKAYGFKLKKEQLVLGEFKAEQVASGVDGLNSIMVFTTDGILKELGMYIIEDPLKIPPYYAPTPVVSGETLEKYPQISKILNPIFENMTTDELMTMNAKVLSKGASGEEVAKEYLKQKGYIK
ncbi:glycine betaine ABC transporter substrate-binding protein [Clostridium cylindrosporum]|uniref:Periplasmic glycine betaine/choline-binding (Lipo)protein of an ABC-type transport system n=1 Tax=Clostridium cylindrosporum DSM 605 TaxID=1121307 RepID=A0A0J8DA54_CLOCY|nr:glycine betaine ABC transporter substrate-binding protein [Clostridium cylindrosporum]KMT22930.1 periplasmic glycine betaine/choline-binding (lipo)protein of an ABC-type transport system [Clostridium cylindrosporum DSM 605]